MLFDDLCKLAERSFPRFQDKCRQARIFRLQMEDAKPGEKATEEWEEDERLIENLRLPFGVIALEHAPEREFRGTQSTILWSIGKDEERRFGFALLLTQGPGELVLGYGETVLFPDGKFDFKNPRSETNRWAVTSSLDVAFIENGKPSRMRARLPDGSVMEGRLVRVRETSESLQKRAVTEGRNVPGVTDAVRAALDAMDNAGSEAFERVAEKLSDKDKAVLRQCITTQKAVATEVREECASKMIVYGLYLAAVEVAFINTPSRFVVEETPIHPAPPLQKGAIRRSPYRPHYIVLKPEQIRRTLIPPAAPAVGEPPIPGGHVKPHERRGHWRTYRAERYKNVKNQRRWIEAMWVGPQDAVVGPNRYVVRIDL